MNSSVRRCFFFSRDWVKLFQRELFTIFYFKSVNRKDNRDKILQKQNQIYVFILTYFKLIKYVKQSLLSNAKELKTV